MDLNQYKNKVANLGASLRHEKDLVGMLRNTIEKLEAEIKKLKERNEKDRKIAVSHQVWVRNHLGDKVKELENRRDSMVDTHVEIVLELEAEIKDYREALELILEPLSSGDCGDIAREALK